MWCTAKGVDGSNGVVGARKQVNDLFLVNLLLFHVMVELFLFLWFIKS